MDENSECDLPHGHFGRGEYLPESSSWQFGRQLTASHHYRLLQLPHSSQPPDETTQDCTDHPPLRGPPSTRYTYRIKSLLKRYPELQPATALIPSLLKVSEAVVRASQHHYSVRGPLLALASVRSQTRHRSVRLAAFPDTDGCSFRLVEVQLSRCGWDGDRSSWLEVPSLEGPETSCGGGNGPLQQICFSSHIERAETLLAVRSLGQIDIYLPTVGKAMPIDQPGSSIRSEHLYCIGAEITGGETLADATFNPWFSQQIGSVDCMGRWKILEFESRGMQRLGRIWTGSVHDSEAGRVPINDGWARIAWISNLETVLVCARTGLWFYNIAKQDPIPLGRIDPDHLGVVPWIVDFQLIPGSTDCFCLLTSEHVLLYHVYGVASLQQRMHPKLKLRHYRNPENLDTRLAVWLSEGHINIAIYSGSNLQIPCFRVNFPEMDQLISHDSIEVCKPPGRDRGISLLDLHIEPVRSKRKSPAVQDGKIPDLERYVEFYSNTVLRSDYSTGECISARAPHAPSISARQLEEPLWQMIPPKRGAKLLQDSFVVEDAPDPMESELRKKEPGPPLNRARNATRQPTLYNSSINLELIASILNRPLDTVKPIDELIADVQDTLSQDIIDNVLPLRTLRSLEEAELSVSGLEQASTQVEESINRSLDPLMNDADGAIDRRHRYIVSDLKLTGIRDLEGELARLEMRTINETLVSKWITPLSNNVSGRTRLAKLSLASQLAADLSLSSRVIHFEEVNQAPTKRGTEDDAHVSGGLVKADSDEEFFSSRMWDLPMRSSGTESSQATSSNLPIPQNYPVTSSLPTPSPTATPSVTATSGHTSSFAAPELHRLSKYTTFTRPAPSVLPRALSNVLSHWDVGKDLEEYDWLSTSRDISKKDEHADEEMTEKERKRMQRRAERHLRKQRKEAAASQAQNFASSQAAEIFSTSQPSGLALGSQATDTGIAGRSQPQSSMPMPASQIIPGRFGGRPPPKKKRKQGF